MQHFFVNLNRIITRHKAIFFILLVMILVAAGYYVSGIKLEEDLNAIIPEDQRISKIGEVFNKSELADRIVFILSYKDTSLVDPEPLIEKAELLVNLLKGKEELIREIRFKMSDDAMMGIYDFIYDNLPLFLNQDDYELIRNRLSEEEIDLAIENNFKSIISPAGMATKKFILKDPLNLIPLALSKLNQFQLDENFTLYHSAIFTRDKKQLLFFLQPAYPSSNTRENLKLIQLIDHSIGKMSTELKGMQVEYYGGTAVSVANAVRIKRDIKLTISIALIVLLLIFHLFFRRFNVIALMFVPVIIGAVFALAVLTMIYGKVSAIALGVGAILIGITVDYSLHLFTHIRSGNSVHESLGNISKPVLMSSLTTALAFLCLIVVDSEAMNQIGIFAASAVIIAAISLLTVTPLLIREREGTIFHRPGSRISSLVEKAVGTRFEKNRILVGAILLLTILFTYSARRIRFNGDISTLNYMTDQLSRSEDHLNSISSVASSSVYLVTQGDSLEEALDKLESHRELFSSLRDEGVATGISTVSELILTRNAQKEKITTWNRFWDEVNREYVKNTITESGVSHHFKEDAFDPFFALLDKRFEPMPLEKYDPLRKLILNNYIAFEGGTCSVISILKVEPQDKELLFERVAQTSDFIIFDTQYFINQFFNVLKEDFNKLVVLSMIVVFLILMLFFGRIEIALIAFIPIMISWMWTLGLMGLFGIEINVFNMIISTFVFGLGIDYSIFMVNGLMAGYRDGTHDLVPYKMSIFLSALTTLAGIGVLIFARHPALKSIALVSIIGISTVVVISFTLLPLLFGILVHKGGKRRLQPVTISGILITALYFFLFLGSALIVSLFLPVLVILPIRRTYKKLAINYAICYFSRFILRIAFFIRKRYLHREILDFSKPSVIISNHQSQLDLLLLLGLHPKIIALVNWRVWHNPFYGLIVRFVDFYPVYKGLDYDFEALKEKVNDGYSILAFPEGSRSPDGKIKRFHQGAFRIAHELGLEIQPVMIHGAYDCLSKRELMIRPGAITLEFLPRMKPRASVFEGTKTFRPQAKEMTAFFRREYGKLNVRLGTPSRFRGKLISQFIYLGPVLEWYARIKLKLEKNYAFYNEIIPRNASVVDLGCGYGFLMIMLGMVSKERKMTGIDYDQEKITVAKNVARDMDHIEFITRDITEGVLPQGDVYVLNDVLHYMPEEMQIRTLNRCMDALPEDGMVILRDADTRLKRRTRMTRFTEVQSTKVFRFNKAQHTLTYLSGQTIEETVLGKGCYFKRYDRSRLTSNITYVITRKKE